jgi:uncharacterized membrane protein
LAEARRISPELVAEGLGAFGAWLAAQLGHPLADGWVLHYLP